MEKFKYSWCRPNKRKRFLCVWKSSSKKPTVKALRMPLKSCQSMITARVMKMMTKQSTFNGSGIFCRCKSRDSAQRYIGQEVCFATNPNTHRITFYETSGKILFQTAPIIQAITTVENGTKIVSFKSCMGDTYSVEPEMHRNHLCVKTLLLKWECELYATRWKTTPDQLKRGVQVR